jgi:hypothetical protein
MLACFMLIIAVLKVESARRRTGVRHGTGT